MNTGASGDVSVLSGARLSTIGSTSYIGNQANTNGTVTVSGTGSQWISDRHVYVGLSGTGSLTLSDHGSASFASMDIGANNGASGTVLVQSGGSLAVTGLVTAANSAGAIGNMTVTGSGSSLTADTLSLGYLGATTFAVSDGATVTAASLDAAGGSGGTAHISISGGGSKLTATNSMMLGAGTGSTGTLSIQNGATLETVAGGLYLKGGSVTTVAGADSMILVGTQHPGTPDSWVTADGWFSLEDATATVSNGARLEADGIYVEGAAAGSASLTVTGAGTVMDGHLLIYVGGNGNGTAGNGALTLSDGATATASVIAVGVDTGTTGTMLLTGTGTSLSTIAHATFLGNVYAGSYGNGIIVVQDGASLTAANELRIAYNAGSAGELAIGAKAGDTAVAAGGVSAAHGIVFGAGTGKLTFNHTLSNYELGSGVSGNGTIGILAGTTILTGDSSGFTGTTAIASGATLQIGNGGSVGTFAGDIANDGALIFSRADGSAFDGVISGTGTLTKAGSGKLLLSGSSGSFTGTTSVTGGTLSVNGTLGNASSTVSVSNGGVLGGSGTIGGSVSITDGVLAPGNSPGTLTINGNLALAANSTLNYELGQAGVVGGSLNDHTIVHGNLTLDGTLNVTQSAGGTYGAGIYRIISYDGTLTDNGLVVGTAPNGSVNYVQTSVANQVNLINTQGLTLRFWDGGAGIKNNSAIEGGSGTWTRAASGASSDNWTLADGTLNAPYTNGAFAVFGGTAGTVTVDNTAGQVQVSGLQFATDGYVVTGGAVELLSGSNTVRVGDGTAGSSAMTATIGSVLTGSGGLDKTDLGTLVLIADNTYSGGTTISSGTLRIGNGGSTGLIAGNVVNNGDFAFYRSADLTFAGDISGTGRFGIGGGMTLTLTGNNTFSGGTWMQGSTLKIGNGGTTGSITGNIATDYLGAGAGHLVFDRSDAITFAGIISGSGDVKQAGSGNLTLSGVNTYTGGTTIASGTLTGSATSFGTGGIANNAALVLDQATNASFASSITGAGSLTKTGAGVLELTGNSSSFTGATTLSQGGLKVNGSLAGSVVTAGTGALLSGSGTVGGIVAQAGSMVSPGNSPGTLTVAGNYSQASGSTYAAELVPGSSTSDLIAVTGTATLASGAVLNVSKYGSTAPYALNAHYTVLTATGGVTGTYVVTGDTTVSAFYSLVAGYDGNSVYLDAKQTRSFASAATTPNQIAVAGGLQSLPAGNALRTALSGIQTDAEARSAFNQLSGEVHSSIKGAMVEDSRFVRSAAIDRIRAAFETVGAPSMASASYGIDGLTFWSNGYGAWGNVDGDGNAAAMSHNVGGFVAGADAPVFDTWRLGVLAGYGRSTYGVNERGSSGNADSYTVGAYGGTQVGSLGLRFGTAYSWNDVTTSRGVGFTGFSDRLTAKYDAGLFQAFGEAGYRIDVGSVSFEPFAGLAHVSLRTGGFTEQGGLAALTARGGSTDVTFSTLGLRAATDFAVGDYTLTATGSVAWRHALGDTTPASTFTLAGSDPFGIAGLPIAQDAALVDVGLSTKLNPNISLGISYTGQFANGMQSQGLRGNLNVKF